MKAKAILFTFGKIVKSVTHKSLDLHEVVETLAFDVRLILLSYTQQQPSYILIQFNVFLNKSLGNYRNHQFYS